MELEAYLRSGYQVESHIPEERRQSQSSGILYQDNYLSQGGGSSVTRPINLSHSVGQMPYQNAQFVTGDVNIRVYSNPMNSDLSIEESSLITDANSSLSGGSYLSSINSIDSPTSNRAFSGSSAGDHFSAQWQNSQEHQSGPRWYRRQGEPFSNPSAMPHLIMAYQPSASPMRTFKKPRLEIRQDVSHPVQQPSPFQYPMRLRGYDPEPATGLFIQQNLLPNQQVLNSLISPQRLQMQSQPPQQLLVDSQNTCSKGSIYFHRLMCYVHQQRDRPPDNNIGYWKKFVEEYYSPSAKKRWCLSKYDDGGRHVRGLFSQAAADTWRCDFCKPRPGKGFVATYEVLPRLKKIFFDSGVTDELLYLNFPSERQLPSGYAVLWFGKAVQQSVYKEFRIVHEGLLRVVFNQELKITSWEFCVQHHEEVIPRRVVAAQVNQVVENAVRFRNSIEEKGTDEVPGEDFLTNCNRLAAAGHELARKVELPLINELGFSKDVVRCLQMGQVLDCMKDLISYSQSKNLSPIESLRRYPAEVLNAKLKMKQMEAQLQMQHGYPHFQGTVAPTVQVPSHMLQTFNPREQASCSGSYHQRLTVEQPITGHTSFLPSHALQIARIPPSSNLVPRVAEKPLQNLRPSSSQEDPGDRILNDLLRLMRDEGAKGACSKTIRGKSRLVYDPNVENPQIVFTQSREECGDATEEKEKAKGLNSSSSSNSNRDITDVRVAKKEPELEEDFTSPPHFQGSSKNDEHHP